MICIFPDPYPDELLYSVCARYAVLMDYPNRVTATRDFFGAGVSTAVVDLPNRVGHLLGALPRGHLYSVNELVYQHTHYPFYAPFLPSGRALQLQDTMRGGGENRVAERIGIAADRLKMPARLRFCPTCVEQDRATLGETYWHRIHQIPCVEVCPHHEVLLEESSALWRNPCNPGEPSAAEYSVPNVPSRALDTSEKTQFIQLNIAHQALLLLERPRGLVDGAALQHRYHNLLLRRGLAYYNGRVCTAQLVRNLLDYYPGELLVHLGCEIENLYSNWFTRLLHMHKAGVTQHPLRHILFLIFIDCSVEELFDSFAEFKPFGDGPWPCLNHASGHYTERRISSCQIRDGEKKNVGKPIGTFSCACGFVYTRSGPDQSEQDCFKWTSIQSYGVEWERLLKRLWKDTSLTLRLVAHKLGVTELTVKRRAIALGLIFPRPTPDSLRSSGGVIERHKIRRKSQRDLRTIHRKKLLSLIKRNPRSSRTMLIALAPQPVDWLRRWDKAWLDARLPPAIRKLSPKTLINWEEQDLVLSEAVKNAALQIHSGIAPKRVSITAIIRLVGHRAWIEKRRGKLPLTSKALDANLESLEGYFIRRIAWAAAAFRKEDVIPSRAMLYSRARLRGRLNSKSERVQSALDSAL